MDYLIKFSILVLLLFFSTALDWGVFLIYFSFAKFRDNRNQQMIAYTIVAMGLLLLVDLCFLESLPTLVLQWMPIGILLVPLVLYYCDREFGSRWGSGIFSIIIIPFICCFSG